MIESNEIKTRIEQAFPSSDIEIKDLTGTKDHYEVTIVSEYFEGLSLLKRHRKIYDLFDDVIGGALHALTLKTYTKSESV